jgi:hypothetical protein
MYDTQNGITIGDALSAQINANLILFDPI